jgi:hypothetical protein
MTSTFPAFSARLQNTSFRRMRIGRTRDCVDSGEPAPEKGALWNKLEQAR